MLERAGVEIGVVEGIVGIHYWEVTFDGVASHAGTTPMADRHDALLAAARFVDAVHAVVIVACRVDTWAPSVASPCFPAART